MSTETPTGRSDGDAFVEGLTAHLDLAATDGSAGESGGSAGAAGGSAGAAGESAGAAGGSPDAAEAPPVDAGAVLA
ncbi:MAG TPA: hypothetical protein VES42_27575, partial [Pilimelia sp.]|nr:hypothetical protein [Pilimelia sp.]